MAKSKSIKLFRSLFKEIKKAEHLKPVYYLHGDEMFFIDLLQDEIEKLVPDSQKDFNYDLIYGSESSPERVLSIASSFPMMAEKRVVIVRDFLKLEDNSDDGKLTDFIHYFKNPNPSTLLCLIDNRFPNKNTKLAKSITSKNSPGAEYEFEKLNDEELPDWIMDWANHSHQSRINPQAALILAQLVGKNLQVLSTEIEKLCTFVDTNQEINVEHVKKITESYREYSVLELKDAVLQRDLHKSLFIAEQMLHRSNNDAGEVFKTVGFFYSVFGNIWKICRLREKGLNKSQVQNQLSIANSYFFNLQWQEASQFRLAEMPGIFEALLDADRAAKGFSTLDTPTILLLLIKRIIG